MNDEVEEDVARLRAAALTKYDTIVHRYGQRRGNDKRVPRVKRKHARILYL